MESGFLVDISILCCSVAPLTVAMSNYQNEPKVVKMYINKNTRIHIHTHTNIQIKICYNNVHTQVHR